MAQNIDKSTNLTSDVYGINSYVNEIKKKDVGGLYVLVRQQFLSLYFRKNAHLSYGPLEVLIAPNFFICSANIFTFLRNL